MPIVTNFAFQQHRRAATAALAEGLLAEDLLGALRGFVGDAPAGKPTRQWAGAGFNLIWRPASKPPFFFLQLMFTNERLQFTDITGSGVANRGLKQGDITLGAMAYLQEIDNRFDGSHQHFEPGVWTRVPKTTAPAEDETYVRMGSIPHGTTINLQGTKLPAGLSGAFPPAPITPFVIGKQDDGRTGLVPFPEQTLTHDSPNTRTALAEVEGLTQAQLDNPNLLLSAANAGLTFESVTAITVASDPSLVSAPDIGGGTGNIAFLKGQGAGGANADAPTATATFWLQRGRDANGEPFEQLQYTQRVLLNFNGLSWPHISVATLRPV